MYDTSPSLVQVINFSISPNKAELVIINMVFKKDISKFEVVAKKVTAEVYVPCVRDWDKFEVVTKKVTTDVYVPSVRDWDKVLSGGQEDYFPKDFPGIILGGLYFFKMELQKKLAGEELLYRLHMSIVGRKHCKTEWIV